ncbi:serine/threonine-protein kinase [Paenibacillus profundus]|uniref:Serine/threonine-protein kinase n=1 Tax=Paenibacillus profundus TaxID=1173085 RepID=A0ABS8YJM1_9BACL|nr:serine/threonine-protein kinase [Paenibacillus profundus]MCE5170437.1 serine/threonine-protein kinase [Paenibacillus profundus]
MAFQPNPGDTYIINETEYRVGEHPAAPGLAYAQAGRQGMVYQLFLKHGDVLDAKALKVFFPKYRIPAMVYQSEQLEAYSGLQGLKVCKRNVLTPEKNGGIIQAHTDLLYAVLMPWVHGPTWLDIVADQRVLTRKDSLHLARSLAQICSGMEQKGLAHCDLSAPNLLLPFFSEVKRSSETSPIELVDVEQLYSPKMDRPDVLLAGSPGYAAHRTIHSGLWSAYADRFAGAVILAEMLGWSDSKLVQRAWGESYFDQHEMQTVCERYGVMKRSLDERWGSKVTELFVRAWESHDLSSCPTFGEWLIVLSGVADEEPIAVKPASAGALEASSSIPTAADSESSVNTGKPAKASVQAEQVSGQQSPTQESGVSAAAVTVSDPNVVNRLFNQARELEQKEQLQGALEVYRSAHHFVPHGSPLEVELAAAIGGLEQKLAADAAPAHTKKPKLRKRTAILLTSALAVLLLGASPFMVSMLQADSQAAAEQAEAERLQAKQREEEAARQKAEAERKQAEEERLMQEEEKKQEEIKRKEAEQQRLAAEKQKQEEQKKKEAEHKQLQQKYDAQAKYEKYVQWKKEKDERLRRQQELERQRKQKEAAELKKIRSRDVVLLIASYNMTYNAIAQDNLKNAKTNALEFAKRYEKDPSYFKKVGKMGERADHIYKFLSNTKHALPDI